jgi:hypothetical protein
MVMPSQSALLPNVGSGAVLAPTLPPRVNGRVKVSQRSAQNVATLGLGQSAYRRAPASGQPRLSYSWRLPGCFGPSGPIYAD